MNEIRKPAGPKKKMENRKIINVSLDELHLEKAREIGRGNVSLGLRMAIESHKPVEKIN